MSWLSLLPLVAALWPSYAQAQIREPGAHPRYTVELEPHLALGLVEPPGVGGGEGLGPGLRLGFPLSEDGFLPKLNDTVALGVGVDWMFYDGEAHVRARCGRFVPAPNDTLVCVELGDGAGASEYLFFPVVMQWNFWLHRRASAFVEPGLAIHLVSQGDARFGEDTDFGVGPVLGFGGRFQFVDFAALTLRLGYPVSSLGVSFFL